MFKQITDLRRAGEALDLSNLADPLTVGAPIHQHPPDYLF
jgi:hypothetical protein